jgi:hypothetical protein
MQVGPTARVRHNGSMVRPHVTLTFVTVVFGAETRLLELQARSFDRYLDPTCVASIIVIDNGWRPMSHRQVSRLRASYGRFADRLTIVRTSNLVPELPSTIGWRSQQLAKLLVARSVTTPHYVVLDAKNHLIRRSIMADFIGPDGRAHGGTHPYTHHPLLPQLTATLRYLHAQDDVIAAAVENFPPTATPFVMDTAVTRELLDGVELASHGPFAREFERAGLTEFFLYSGWIVVRGPGIDRVYDGVAIPSPTVWPGRRDANGVDDAIAEAQREGSAFFAVHRSALARGDRASRARIARFWRDRGLFSTVSSARRFIGSFRLLYLPEMASKKLAERLTRTERR